MADSKISALSDAGALQAGDLFVLARSGSDLKKKLIGFPELVFRYTVAGSDKASIDTGVDTPDAGTNDWTNGDLLEVFLLFRTDDAGAGSNPIINLNNDSSAVYDRSAIAAANTTLTASPTLADTKWVLGGHGSGGSANYASPIAISFPDYAGTTFYKVGMLLQNTLDATAGNTHVYTSALGYRSTSAITRLAFAAAAGQKLKVGSQLLIYKRIAG